MNPLGEQFDRQLIAAQQVDDQLRQNYEREINNMLQQTLTPTRKVSFIASTVICTVMMGALSMAALTTPDLPFLMRIGLWLGVAYAAGWLIMSLRILRRGSIHVRNDMRWMSALPWLFGVALVTIIFIATGQRADSVRSVWMLLFALTFLIMGSMWLIQYWIQDSRLKMEERLLETQLRIAQLAEELKRRQ